MRYIYNNSHLYNNLTIYQHTDSVCIIFALSLLKIIVLVQNVRITDD